MLMVCTLRATGMNNKDVYYLNNEKPGLENDLFIGRASSPHRMATRQLLSVKSFTKKQEHLGRRGTIFPGVSL